MTNITAEKLKIGDIFHDSNSQCKVIVQDIAIKLYKNGNPYFVVTSRNMESEKNKKRIQGVVSEKIINRFKPKTKVNVINF